MKLSLLLERYANLFTPAQKAEYIDQVWDVLVSSYKPIGGLKGISNKNELLKIPMWKVLQHDHHVVAVVLYKDKGTGRKLIALGTDGSPAGKTAVKEIMRAEFSRSFFEISGPLLRFVDKTMPDLVKKYTISIDNVKKILNKPDIVPTSHGRYTRSIGGTKLEKLMLGTVGKNIR